MLLDIDTFADACGRDPFVAGTLDERKARYALDGAEGLVLSKTNHDDDWLTLEQIPRAVQTIMYEVGARRFTNPKGLLSRNVGPLAESMTREQAAGLALTDAELDTLAPYTAPGRGGIRSVELVRPDRIAKDVLYFTDGYPGSIMRIPYADEYGVEELYPE